MAVTGLKQYNTETKEYEELPPVGVGLTIGTGEHYQGDCQYSYYAIVWDPEAGKPTQVTYGYDQSVNWAKVEVDASPEVVAAYEAYQALKRTFDWATQAVTAASKLEAGKTVEVVRGRKIPKGTVAKVFWYGPDKFKYHAYRVGLEVEGEKVFTDAYNVQVVVDPALTAEWEAAKAAYEAGVVQGVLV